MPYKSEAQRKFFHTDTARRKGITAKVVKEFDKATGGRKLPIRVKGKNHPMELLKRGMQGKKR